jgi:4-aminobutyrate aminotransferase
VLDRSSKEPANDAADVVLYKALSKGLSFKTTMGNILTLTPPLIVTEAQMHKAMDIIDECLSEVERDVKI